MKVMTKTHHPSVSRWACVPTGARSFRFDILVWLTKHAKLNQVQSQLPYIYLGQWSEESYPINWIFFTYFITNTLIIITINKYIPPIREKKIVNVLWCCFPHDYLDRYLPPMSWARNSLPSQLHNIYKRKHAFSLNKTISYLKLFWRKIAKNRNFGKKNPFI